MDKPRTVTRIFFCLLLGLLSTFFAEVLSGSAPDYLLTAFGYWGIFPLYCLHTLFLASIIMTRERSFSLRTLYLASLLFGMYEAYITKILWHPSWSPETFKIGELAVAETLLLVFYWHSLFSFLIPLFVGENLLAGSNNLTLLLPEKWQTRVRNPRFILLFGGYSSILLAAAASSVEDALGLALLNSTAVSAAILLWRWLTRKKTYDFTELLPSGKGIILVAVLLAFIYLNFGFNLSTDALPEPIGHISVLLLYILFILLIRRSVRLDREQRPVSDIAAPVGAERFSLKHWFLFCAAFILSAALLNLLPFAVRELLTGVVFISGIIMGVLFFIRSIRALYRPDTPGPAHLIEPGENTL